MCLSEIPSINKNVRRGVLVYPYRPVLPTMIFQPHLIFQVLEYSMVVGCLNTWEGELKIHRIQFKYHQPAHYFHTTPLNQNPLTFQPPTLSSPQSSSLTNHLPNTSPNHIVSRTSTGFRLPSLISSNINFASRPTIATNQAEDHHQPQPRPAAKECNATTTTRTTTITTAEDNHSKRQQQ